MSTPQPPREDGRQAYLVRPAGCCDLPRTVRLTDAEAAPGLAKGLLQRLADPLPSTPKPELQRSFLP